MGQRKFEREIAKRNQKRQDKFFEGKTLEERKIFLMINSELEIIAFLTGKSGDKERIKIFEKARTFMKKDKYPSIFHNVIQLMKIEAPGTKKGPEKEEENKDKQ